MDVKYDVPKGALLATLNKRFKHAIQIECNKAGINSTYSHIVMLLARNKEGVPQNVIAEHVHLAAPTVSLTLNNMEAIGYITRCQDEIDKRKTIVKLTELGYSVDNQIQACFKVVEKQLIQDISKDDLDAFDRIIRLMLENLDEKENN